MKWMRFLSLAAACAGLMLTACSSTEEDLCDDKCACEGCSDFQYNDCLADYDNDERNAEFWGCEDFYEEWIDCRDATWICRGADFDTACGLERERYRNCVRD
jgi:hypothetical protein